MVDPAARVWLVAVREEIGSIRVLTDNATANGMSSFPMRRALQHSLLIVAEATRQVPKSLKATRPDLPWTRLDALDSLLGHELGAGDGIVDDGEPWPLISDHLEDLDAAAEAWLAEG